MGKLTVNTGTKADIGPYKQEPSHYTECALGMKLRNEFPQTTWPFPKVGIKRFKDVQVGDHLYSVSVGKIIEYIVTDISEENVEVVDSGKWGQYKASHVCNRVMVTYTYKSIKGGKTNTLSLFKEQERDTWNGFDRTRDGRPSKIEDRQMYPNIIECATDKKIFSSQEACMWYLHNLYEERIFKVEQMMEKVSEELKYANEYTPTLESWGWKKPKMHYELIENNI